MKILICADSLGVGGAETHVIALARGLSRLGHSVTVAADYGELCPSLFSSEGDLSFVRIAFSPPCPNAVLSLVRLIKKGGFGIVHAHSRPSALAVAIARRMIATERFGFVVTAHAHYAKHPIKDSLTVWGDAIIAVSSDIRDLLSGRFGIPRDRVTVIPNGVDTDRFHPAEGSAKNNFRILFASRLDRDCSLGALALCKVAKELKRSIPNLKITVAGGGELLDRVRAAAKRTNRDTGDECIRVVGSALDMPSLIADTDLCVGVSRFALEAMAMKKPVVLFGNEGALGLFEPSKLRAAIRTNFTARQCESPSPSLLCREILRLYRMSDTSRREISDLGYRTVTHCYSAEKAALRTLEVYKTVFPRPTATLGGYYGFGNLGDETVRSILLSSLTETVKDIDVRVLTASPTAEKREVDRRRPLHVIRSLIDSDVYISGGGSLLQSATSLRSLAYYCALIALARLLGCRVILASNGLGPLDSRVARAMARAALMRSDYISVRDPLSLRLAVSLTGGRRDVRLSADPAFSLEAEAARNGGSLAVSFRDSELRSPVLNAALSELCRGDGRPLTRVPMDSPSSTPQQRTQEVLSALSNCRGAVGSRLHFLIFAILSGTPVAPVGSDPKLSALSLMTLGLPSIDPHRFSSPLALARKIEDYLAFPSAWQSFIELERRLYRRDVHRIALFIKKISKKD